MDTVAFITTKMSRKGDLILSFAIEDGRWPGGIRSLVLLRCPKFEGIFEESERGITVSMEGEDEKGSDLEGNLLSECTLDGSAKTICVRTPKHSYDLGLGKVKAQMLEEMRELLARMNFDGKAKLAGL